ncbi:hypothetical protein B0T19DRAFT_401583 [Cercophora scortea]|uniref:Uncharacterized protein n=1 Tax=Cercophora scortea TaxID=314031 RepID=A0AAE0IDR5_9PEZI|nr:hypothetical protein B0T19DRAFT_401583 [Cercophora scortea]
MAANMDHVAGSEIFRHWEKTTANRDSTVEIFARMLAHPDRTSAVVAFWKRIRRMTISTAADSSAILADFQTLGVAQRSLFLRLMGYEPAGVVETIREWYSERMEATMERLDRFPKRQRWNASTDSPTPGAPSRSPPLKTTSQRGWEAGIFLPAESVAAFALVDRHLSSLLDPHERAYTIVSPATKTRYRHSVLHFRDENGDVNMAAKWQFLRLLEHDTKLLVACPTCTKLHSFLPKRLSCVKQPGVPETRLPASLNYNMVRMIANQWARSGGDAGTCRELVRLSEAAAGIILEDVKVFCTVTSRLVNGNLLSRTQTVIAPLTSGRFTGNSFSLLESLINSEANRICDDIETRSTGFVTYAPEPDDDPLGVLQSGSTPLAANLERFITTERLQDMLYSNKALGRASVRSCPWCATDYCQMVAAQDVPGLGRVLVRTSWKDLGGAGGGENGKRSLGRWKWDSHRDVVARRGRYQCLRDLAYRKASTGGGGEPGKIALAFESSLPPGRRSVIGWGRYEPYIEEWVLERMRELPSARTEEERAEQETRFRETFYDQVPDDEEDSDDDDGGPYHGSFAVEDSDISWSDSD